MQMKDGVLQCLCAASVDVSSLQHSLPSVEGMYQVFDLIDMKVGQTDHFSFTGALDVKSEGLVNGYERYTTKLAGRNAFVF